MSKYIIDTDKYYLHEFDGALIVMMHEGKPVSVYESKDNLEELNSDYINEHFGELQDTAYKKGLHAGESKCGYCNEYKQGLNDAWEAARKISLMTSDEIEKVFPGAAKYNRYNLGYSGVEAIEKLKAYEEHKDDSIKVGDEVIWRDTTTLIVTAVYKDGGFNWCDGISQDGRAFHVLAENVCKTGKNYDSIQLRRKEKEC